MFPGGVGRAAQGTWIPLLPASSSVRKDGGIPGFGGYPSQLMSPVTQDENERPEVWRSGMVGL